MELKDKYEEWNEIFWRYFITTSKNAGDILENGANIPYHSITWDNKLGNVGDGTINLAKLMTYIYISNKNGVIHPINLSDCLDTLYRLEKNAYNYFSDAFPHFFTDSNVKDKIYSQGFFVRDDIDEHKVSWGNWRMLHNMLNEDPCHSPFVSQDQVWNLNPILSCIMLDESLDNEVRLKAKDLGMRINGYIKNNGYTIYNPYLSYINHMFSYLPDFDLSLIERCTDRMMAFKPNIKVKRGANNWYYSGGTKAGYDAFEKGKKDYSHTFRTFLYRGIIFVLDKIYEPIYRLFTKKDFKHNSYYCYGATSGIWYSKNYVMNFLKRFNKSLEAPQGGYEELFQSNIAPIVLTEGKDVNLEGLETYLDNYEAFKAEGTIYDPLDVLTLYQWYNYISTKNS